MFLRWGRDNTMVTYKITIQDGMGQLELLFGGIFVKQA